MHAPTRKHTRTRRRSGPSRGDGDELAACSAASRPGNLTLTGGIQPSREGLFKSSAGQTLDVGPLGRRRLLSVCKKGAAGQLVHFFRGRCRLPQRQWRRLRLSARTNRTNSGSTSLLFVLRSEAIVRNGACECCLLRVVREVQRRRRGRSNSFALTNHLSREKSPSFSHNDATAICLAATSGAAAADGFCCRRSSSRSRRGQSSSALHRSPRRLRGPSTAQMISRLCVRSPRLRQLGGDEQTCGASFVRRAGAPSG